MGATGEWLVQPGGLAERLWRMRRDAGLTGDEIVARMGWRTRSRVPKIENGRQLPTPDDIRAWATACGHPELIDELLGLLDEAETMHRQFKHQSSHAAVQRDLDKRVRAASQIVSVQLTWVPGLLQTAEYARRRLIEARRISGKTGDLDADVAERLRRQAVLYEGGRKFEFILLESVLQIGGGPDDVMVGQLNRLLSMFGVPDVTLRVIPLGPELERVPAASFMQLDDRVYYETHTGEVLVSPGETASYPAIIDELRAESVADEAAQALIIAASASRRPS